MVLHWKKTGNGIVEWDAPASYPAVTNKVKHLKHGECVGEGCAARFKTQARKQYASIFNNRDLFMDEGAPVSAGVRSRSAPQNTGGSIMRTSRGDEMIEVRERDLLGVINVLNGSDATREKVAKSNLLRDKIAERDAGLLADQMLDALNVW